MSFCESWNFLIMARHAALRPSSCQNQVMNLSSFLAPCKNAGAERGLLAALASPPLPAIRPPAVAAAPIFMNSRRLIVFLGWLSFLSSCSDIVFSSFLIIGLRTKRLAYKANHRQQTPTKINLADPPS